MTGRSEITQAFRNLVNALSQGIKHLVKEAANLSSSTFDSVGAQDIVEVRPMLRPSRSVLRSLSTTFHQSEAVFLTSSRATFHVAVPTLDARLLPVLTSSSASHNRQLGSIPFAVHGHRWRSGLAQREEPVEEADLGDHKISEKAAGEAPDKTFDQGGIAPTPGLQKDGEAEEKQDKEGSTYTWFSQPVYSAEYLASVKPRHLPPETFRQKVASFGVTVTRTVFDTFTSYDLEKMNEKKWLRRFVFLETIAGVPGMVGGMLRHMKSLRTMRRDNGWIHTLLEEAENERMHLLTFLQLRQPGLLFRGTVLLAQGVFFNAYFLAYLISPRSCHAFVGYLEEEAVKTYTHALHDLDAGRLPEWSQKQAPAIARDYWKLGEDATMRELLMAVRADEACHSHVNHTFSELNPHDKNPFAAGTHHVPQA